MQPEAPLLLEMAGARSGTKELTPEFIWKRERSGQHAADFWWCEELPERHPSRSMWTRPDLVEHRIQQGAGSDGLPYSQEEFTKFHGDVHGPRLWSRAVKVGIYYKRRGPPRRL